MLEYEIVLCECNWAEHQLLITKDEYNLYLEVHLAQHSFFKRLKIGLAYIFGHRSRYGAWEEFIIGDTAKERLLKVLNG